MSLVLHVQKLEEKKQVSHYDCLKKSKTEGVYEVIGSVEGKIAV
jgi:hypothetical protein